MFLLFEGIRNLFRTKLASLIVTGMIALSLLISGLFFAITLKLMESSDFFDSAAEIEVFLNESLQTSEIESLQQELRTYPGVRSVHFISKDSAAVLFAEEIGENIYSLLGENPLPSSFRIGLEPDLLSRDSIDSLTEFVSNLSGVDDVVAYSDFIFDIFRYRTSIWILHSITGIVLIFFTLLLVANTTKLSIYSRKNSIEVMKLVGATNRFIKGPFVVEGFLQGFLGGLICIGIAVGLSHLANYFLDLSFQFPQRIVVSVIGGGCLLGISGSYNAVRKYLSRL